MHKPPPRNPTCSLLGFPVHTLSQNGYGYAVVAIVAGVVAAVVVVLSAVAVFFEASSYVEDDEVTQDCSQGALC